MMSTRRTPGGTKLYRFCVCFLVGEKNDYHKKQLLLNKMVNTVYFSDLPISQSLPVETIKKTRKNWHESWRYPRRIRKHIYKSSILGCPNVFFFGSIAHIHKPSEKLQSYHKNPVLPPTQIFAFCRKTKGSLQPTLMNHHYPLEGGSLHSGNLTARWKMGAPDWVDVFLVFPITNGYIPAIAMWSFTRGFFFRPEPFFGGSGLGLLTEPKIRWRIQAVAKGFAPWEFYIRRGMPFGTSECRNLGRFKNGWMWTTWISWVPFFLRGGGGDVKIAWWHFICLLELNWIELNSRSFIAQKHNFWISINRIKYPPFPTRHYKSGLSASVWLRKNCQLEPSRPSSVNLWLSDQKFHLDFSLPNLEFPSKNLIFPPKFGFFHPNFGFSL